MLLLDVVGVPEVQFGLVQLLLVLGEHDASDDVLNDHQVVVDQHEVVLVDLLDVLGQEAPLFVDHLPGRDDGGLGGLALLVFLVDFLQVLVGEYFVVEGDGVLVGLVTVDNDLQFLAVAIVKTILIIVLFLLLNVALKLPYTPLALPTQLLLLLLDALLLHLLQVEQVQLGIAFNLQRKLSVEFRQVNYVVRLLGVEADLDHILLEPSHLPVNLLRKRVVQVFHPVDKTEKLVLGLVDVLAPSDHAPDLRDDFVVLFDLKHAKRL